MKTFNVWVEGYSATGGGSQAWLKGLAQADNFEEACCIIFNDDPYFNKDKLSVWGCRLFDNESDARKSFG